MLISLKEHGQEFTSVMAKGMIYGSPSVVTYAVSVYFFYPFFGIILGTIYAYIISLIVTLVLFAFRKKIR